MSGPIDATYDGTVFRPLQPVALPANTPVRLIVETVSVKSAAHSSFLKTAQSLRLEGPSDWSENLDKYLYDEESQSGS
jgi:predicted DNA-binding antitoxin AbrB/MazE fold protein